MKITQLVASASLIALAACSNSETDTSMTETANTTVETALETASDAASAMPGSYTPVAYETEGQTDADHLWLEEVEGEEALAKVRGWNERSLARLKADPRYQQFYDAALEVVNSQDKIAYVTQRGDHLYNFWQDDTHVRGLWRRTTLDSYLSDSPDWETVIDFDKLAADEDANWVYKGVNCLGPDYARCIVNLSDGGKDAVVRREFDMTTKSWVEDGFVTEESKGTIDWVDADTVVVGVDFGPDESGVGSMTDSGYPRIAKLWKRGQPLSEALTLGEGEQADVGYWPSTIELEDGSREIVVARSKTFYDSEYYHVPVVDGVPQAPVRFPVPEKSDIGGLFKGQMLLRLNEDWRDFKSGDLVSFELADFVEDGEISDVNLVVRPDAKSSLGGFGVTADRVLANLTTDVKGRIEAFDWADGAWSSTALDLPANGSTSIVGTNDKSSIAFVTAENFLQPDTLYVVDTSGDMTPREVKSLPTWFDASSMVAEQFFATSKDGTQVPYFVVRAKDAPMDGSNPTLLYGYGGFEIPLNPAYSATRGRLWLEQGGVYVLANIRGGAEYGPKWHQAGLKTERQRIYDDFIAVAEDLIDKGITSPDHLGVEGGSNGGLLTGVMTTQRPDLFNAAIIAVPLLDMMRYHTLLAGASWMGEYGDPEDEVEGAFLRSISPYHNLRADVDYPEVFLVTSTKDDRVHPGHARKFAQRMEDQGHDFLYYENIDGGHSAAANLKETANRLALQHVYLLQQLGGE